MWRYFSPQEKTNPEKKEDEKCKEKTAANASQTNGCVCSIPEAGYTLTLVSEGYEKDASDTEMEEKARDMSYESSLKDDSDRAHSDTYQSLKIKTEQLNDRESYSGNKGVANEGYQTEVEAKDIPTKTSCEVHDNPDQPGLQKSKEIEIGGLTIKESYSGHTLSIVNEGYQDENGTAEIKVNDDDMKQCLEPANKAPISSATQTEESGKHSFSGEKEQGYDNVEQKEEDNDDIALNTRDAFAVKITASPETETWKTALFLEPDEHGSNEEEKERDSVIKCELAAVSVPGDRNENSKTFKDWLMDPNLYKVSLPNINSKVIPIEVKTHNCSQAAVDGEQNLLQKHAIPIVPIFLFFL